MCRELGTSCFPVHLRSEVATKVKRNVNPLKSDFARADLIEAESIEAFNKPAGWDWSQGLRVRCKDSANRYVTVVSSSLYLRAFQQQ